MDGNTTVGFMRHLQHCVVLKAERLVLRLRKVEKIGQKQAYNFGTFDGSGFAFAGIVGGLAPTG
jgi:hypothetical protein